MNKKKGLLQKLAIAGIRKNAAIYAPYIAAGIFSAFTYFTFDSILNNRIMQTLPKAMYAWALMTIGFVLLGIILLLFLFYTNSFLIKRRTKELGLYRILGMEKKHIGIMLFFETVFLFCIVVAGGILAGVVFSKLIFLFLINLTGLSSDISFMFSPKAFLDTVLFFGVVYSLNLITNLIHVGRSNPTELMNAGKKGEKESKHLWLVTIIGAALMGGGYYIAMTASMNSFIFTDFFLAVLLVILGTYFLFTSGSIAMLHLLKKKETFYYRSTNFITVSGMLYRMKKNAAGLVNICIFATMVMITLLCTASLYIGMDGVMEFMYPYDAVISYSSSKAGEKERLTDEIEELAENSEVSIEDFIVYARVPLRLGQADNQITKAETYQKKYDLSFLTAEEYNGIEGNAYSLEEDEVLIYSTGNDFAYDTIILGTKQYRVKKEIQTSVIKPKEAKNIFSKDLYIIVKDNEALNQCMAFYEADIERIKQLEVNINISGKEHNKKIFMENVSLICGKQPGFIELKNSIKGKEEIHSMYGGLLFIGIFFGIIFTMCLLLTMYYKQITEGFEDKDSFEIMQKVGMSDIEVKATIKKQILLVFFLPLMGAVLHMAVGLNMVVKLFETLSFYNTALIYCCTVIVVGIFIIFYLLSYRATAKTYYKIVKQME